MSAIAAFVAHMSEPDAKPRTRTRKGDVPKSKRKSRFMSPVQVAMDDAKRRARSGEWEDAKGATFVGLHALCHEMVYGVVPSELEVRGVFMIASRSAARAQHELFDDDPNRMVEFVRWSWEREKRRASYALASGHDRSRLGWKFQFSRALQTDFLIARTQRKV